VDDVSGFLAGRRYEGASPQPQSDKSFLVPLFFKKAVKKETNHG